MDDFIIKLQTAKVKELKTDSKDIGKYLLNKFKNIKNLPSNIGSETKKAEKYIKNLFKRTEENVFIDPLGSQEPPDIILNGNYVELKNIKTGSFRFNDSPIEQNTTYVFISVKKQTKVFIVKGKYLPTYPLEYKQDIIELREKWRQFFKDDVFYFAYVRPNVSLKSKFMKDLPALSYFDGKVLWV